MVVAALLCLVGVLGIASGLTLASHHPAPLTLGLGLIACASRVAWDAGAFRVACSRHSR